LQCVAVCCSVLQCVAVCCSVLQCVAVCHSVLQCVAVCSATPRCRDNNLHLSVLQSVLQCVTVCCSVLQVWIKSVLQYIAVRGSALQCVAMCCCVSTCVAVCCCVLQRVAIPMIHTTVDKICISFACDCHRRHATYLPVVIHVFDDQSIIVSKPIVSPPPLTCSRRRRCKFQYTDKRIFKHTIQHTTALTQTHHRLTTHKDTHSPPPHAHTPNTHMCICTRTRTRIRTCIDIQTHRL